MHSIYMLTLIAFVYLFKILIVVCMFRVFRNIFRINQFFKDAQTQFANKDFKKALSLYTESLKSHPTYLPALLGKSKCQLQLGNPKQAQSTLSPITEDNLQQQYKQDLNVLKGRLELSKSDFNKAAEYFRKSVQLTGKEQTRSCIYRLFCLTNTKKINEYMKEVDELLASRKAKPYHYFEKAWGLFQSHKFIEAIALFDRYIQLGGKDQYTYFYRGSCERALNHLEEADKDFRKSLEIEDSFIDAQLALGDVLINQQKFEQALEVANKSCQNYPLIEYPIFMKGFCLYRLGKFTEAENQFTKSITMTEKDPNMNSYTYRGICRLALRKPQEAAGDFKKKLQLDPDDPENYAVKINLANIEFQQGNHAEALKYYNDAEKEQPDDADLLHQKGNLLAVIGQLKEAEDYINKAIDKQPAVSLFRQSLAALNIMKKNYKQAQRILKDCLKMDQKNFSIYSKLAQLYLQTNDHSKAINLLSTAIDTHPNQPGLRLTMAMVKLQSGESDSADKILQELIKEYPNVLDVRIARIELLRKMGRNEEAREVIEETKKMTESQEVRGQIDKM